MSKMYKRAALGGTFDHFHRGHEYFLLRAAELCEELWIGITTPVLLQHKICPDSIESYEIRSRSVESFLSAHGIACRLFPLTDIYGETLENSPVEAVIVTNQTQQGGEAINRKRVELGLTTLPLHVVELIMDEGGELISSTNIRLGRISRKGVVYASLFKHVQPFSEQQRVFFRHPQGKQIDRPSSEITIRYVIGDVVLDTFLQNGWPYTTAVFDRRSQRAAHHSPRIEQLHVTTEVNNKAGEISTDLVAALEHPGTIFVHGEEDLAAVAAVLLAPLNAAIYYGQPHVGMIEMIVTEHLKDQFYELLSRR